jgi:hypothetical protein
MAAGERMRHEVMDLRDVGPQSALARTWDKKVRAGGNLYAMYHSREWLSCIRESSLQKHKLLVSYVGGDTEDSCIAALALRPLSLQFPVWRRVETAMRIPGIEILGGRPVGDATHDYYPRLVSRIWSDFPQVQGIYLKSVPDDSELWAYLQDQCWRIGPTKVYRPEDMRSFHYVSLPSTMQDYFAKFKKKRRYNLKRQVRLLWSDYCGDVEMSCITRAEDVPILMKTVRSVVEHSWKASGLGTPLSQIAVDAHILAKLATRGLLRAYVLRIKGGPVAYVIGYEFNNIYHYADIGYDSRFESHSPGNVLLLLVIQDLIEVAKSQCLNFGISDAQYKRIFANKHIHDATLLMLRPGLGNDSKRHLHAGYRTARTWAKKLLNHA